MIALVAAVLAAVFVADVLVELWQAHAEVERRRRTARDRAEIRRALDRMGGHRR